MRLAQQLSPEVGAVDELPVVDRLQRVLLPFLLQNRVPEVDRQLTDVDECVSVSHLSKEPRLYLRVFEVSATSRAPLQELVSQANGQLLQWMDRLWVRLLVTETLVIAAAARFPRVLATIWGPTVQARWGLLERCV